jgi:hypothetical protein
MAEVNVAQKLSFGEIAKRTDGYGGLVPIYEAMNEVNPVFPYIPAHPASHRFHHQATKRTSLPTATWRQFYSGTGTKASTTQVVKFPVGLLEIRSEIDEDLVDTAEDPEGTRRQEDMAFTQGMQQQVMDALISGTTTAYPERIDGIQQYLNDLDHTMVIDGGNSGGTSIYIIDFSKCFMCYPRNVAKMGLDIRTNPSGSSTGKERLTDSNSNVYYGYCTQFKWWVGWVVLDELSIGRVANINATVGGSNTFDENDLIQLLTYGRFNPSTTFILCAKEILAQMQIKLKDKANVNFSVAEGLSGRPVTMFQNTFPVMRCDSISTSESAVTS